MFSFFPCHHYPVPSLLTGLKEHEHANYFKKCLQCHEILPGYQVYNPYHPTHPPFDNAPPTPNSHLPFTTVMRCFALTLFAHHARRFLLAVMYNETNTKDLPAYIQIPLFTICAKVNRCRKGGVWLYIDHTIKREGDTIHD